MSDYIDREKARECVCSFCTWVGTSNCEECEHPIYDIPTADVAPVKRGRWIEGVYGSVHLICSACNFEWMAMHRTNYCPNCGAEMGER